MDDLAVARAVVLGVLLVGTGVLLPSLPGRVVALHRTTAPARSRLAMIVRRMREAGSRAVARRAAAGLLGSASALAVAAAPARAAAPDRAAVTTPPSTGRPGSAPAGAAATAAPATVVVVRRGDTLWDLARQHLPAGATDAQVAREWPRWYAANRSVIGPDPGLLLPGQRLRVPGARRTGTSSTPLHRSPVTAPGPRTAASATFLDPDRR